MNEIMLCPYEALAAPTSGSSHSIAIIGINYRNSKSFALDLITIINLNFSELTHHF